MNDEERKDWINNIKVHLIYACFGLAVVSAVVAINAVRKQSALTLDRIAEHQSLPYRIYKNKEEKDLYVKITTLTGIHYFSVERKTAKTPLGLVDDSLKVGKKGYNHELLTKILYDLNNETLAKTNSVRSDRTYYGLGPEIPKPDLEGLTGK
ncbi:hypothetical protein HYU07_01185 [Candidatus Woesearchaeota archaeon]|nr:hypothetical protein [Candidatus Woesearchaeota archaeon]